MSEQTYTIQEIADNIAGFTTGEFGTVAEAAKYIYLNALNQLEDDQDGIQAVIDRKNNNMNQSIYIDTLIKEKEELLYALSLAIKWGRSCTPDYDTEYGPINHAEDVFKKYTEVKNIEQPKTIVEPNEDCGCAKCNPKARWMILCSVCGNKRCPKANDHDLECSNSNEIGQKGSSWEHVKPL